MRAYLSSTFLDLEDCREQVLRALSRIRVPGVAMESYVAAPESPLERCLRDVAECDFYIGVFAWRYGYIPPGASNQWSPSPKARPAHSASRAAHLAATFVSSAWVNRQVGYV
jgi:Domain of unknown function (DUF4062)